MDATQPEKAYLWLIFRWGHLQRMTNARMTGYWLEHGRNELCRECVRKLADFERVGKKPEMSGV